MRKLKEQTPSNGFQKKTLEHYKKSLRIYVERDIIESEGGLLRGAAEDGVTDIGFYKTAFNAFIKAKKYKLAMELVEVMYKVARIRDMEFYTYAFDMIQKKVDGKETEESIILYSEALLLFTPILSK